MAIGSASAECHDLCQVRQVSWHSWTAIKEDLVHLTRNALRMSSLLWRMRLCAETVLSTYLQRNANALDVDPQENKSYRNRAVIYHTTEGWHMWKAIYSPCVLFS